MIQTIQHRGRNACCSWRRWWEAAVLFLKSLREQTLRPGQNLVLVIERYYTGPRLHSAISIVDNTMRFYYPSLSAMARDADNLCHLLEEI